MEATNTKRGSGQCAGASRLLISFVDRTARERLIYESILPRNGFGRFDRICIGLIDRRSFTRGVFPGKRAQNHALCWAENGSGWERIMNAGLAPRLIAFPVVTHRLAR